MQRIRFVMVGGFLGAGKTTALARLARFYLGRGQRIGLVTNDQAQNLVDTNTFRAQGFPVEEVPGACFCCKFDELMSRVENLREAERPDVILAEPVGSCTDLVATVVQPLKALYGGRFQVAPYPVLFKPSHGLRILRNEGGFSPKAAYIFRKQLEEADAILINRIDELPAAELNELTDLVARHYPGVPLLRVSAKTGQGFDALTALLDQEGAFGRKILDIDYDTYAEGEAEMGWLNSSVHVEAAKAFDLDSLLWDITDQLRGRIRARGAEVAHLKAIGLGSESFGVANLVSSSTAPELSLPSNSRVTEVDLIVNARVAIDPAVLETDVREVVTACCQERGAGLEFRQTQSLRPARPVPPHRYAAAVCGGGGRPRAARRRQARGGAGTAARTGGGKKPASPSYTSRWRRSSSTHCR
ncbi:MAG: cobalamin biosynthesis protein P47K [Gemmataceae bacterium]|nr:cobalamin biosynthesis protein P47K [Gemmataceae bacterium]MDW8266640.1 GTP-binding protein [Gemmataceae bacterium]